MQGNTRFFLFLPVMKKLGLLFIACFSYMLGLAQYGTQFENRGFETWENFVSNDNDTYEPVHWHSGMSASGGYASWLSKQIEPSNQTRPGSSGSKSIRLWPRSVVFTTANGNLTNGRMNAGSMSTTGTDNYNYTQRDDSRFNTPITTVPDSLTVWVCFRSNSTSYEAQARAAIHGDADFQFVANGTMNPSNQLVAIASENFGRTSTSGGSYTWRRLSIPFEQNGPCNDPRYILFTITTNKEPGSGSTSDDLFVDDILLIYNPSIYMSALDKDHYLMGESLNIPFTLEGTMSPENLQQFPNEVIAQLSSANGSFSDPTELGRVTTDNSGSISVNIPSGIFEGTGYRIRLVTTNYPMISEDNGMDLTIMSPSNEIVENGLNEAILEVEIFDLTGRPVTNKDLAPGVYIKKIRTANGYTVQKFLKQ